MTKEKAGGYISKIVFNNEESIDIRCDDIIIFVGPNNAGKSQSLKDIYNLSKSKETVQDIVISNIIITKSNASVSDILDKISVGILKGPYKEYNILGQIVDFWNNSNERFQEEPYFGGFRNLFVANLNTEARLNICKPPDNIQRNSPKLHPIHYAAFDSKYRKWLSKNFKKAFGVEVTPNTQYGAKIPLCIGAPIKLQKEFEDEQSRLEAYAEKLETYKQVQNQGDGIKSFTGILLYLMLDYFCIYLIDEPESFLHPPQARIMGQIIGETLSNQQQAFISTHSEDIIMGLLEVCPERIKLIRITREDDTNFFSVLDNTQFSKVWKDPLLKYSKIMSSLFHKSVILCESDSDCKMYSIIENYLKQANGIFSETLFIHCGGKHRMAKISTALRSLNINIKLIPDIDVLDDEKVFKSIVEAFGINWSSVEKDYHIIVSNLHSSKENVIRSKAKSDINSILDKSKNEFLLNKEQKEIREVIHTISKWDQLKKVGITIIPSGDATRAFERLDKTLKDNDIYLVSVGELENFIKEVSGHGPEWVNKVLEDYSDLNDKVYDKIKEFIAELNL